ncbi:MAG: hypothetical protein H7841_01515 [Magnetospirillum sp. WYHS-4]
MADTAYEVHSQVEGKWRMESVYDERELSIASAAMLIEDRANIAAVRVVELVPVPGGKPKGKIIHRIDRDGTVRAVPAKPKTAPVPRPAATPVIPNLPRRPIPQQAPRPAAKPIPSVPAKDAARRPPSAAAKTKASRISTQIILYILVIGGLGLGALAAITFAKQLIRLL